MQFALSVTNTKNYLDVYSLVSGCLNTIVVWMIFWSMVSSTIRSEAAEFDYTFSWSLAIRIFIVYVSYSRFRFTVRSKMHLDKIYQS